MDDLRRHLQAADPLKREPGLTPLDVQVMRQEVLRVHPYLPRHPQTVLLVLVTSLAVVVGAGTWVVWSAQTGPPAAPSRLTPASRGTEPTTGRRQLHLLAPGGTRVIWTLNATPTEGTP